MTHSHISVIMATIEVSKNICIWYYYIVQYERLTCFIPSILASNRRSYMNGVEKLRKEAVKQRNKKEKLDEKDKRIRILFIKMGFMFV